MSSIGFSAFTASDVLRRSDNCLDPLPIIPIIFNFRARNIAEGGREGGKEFPRVSVRIDKYEPAKGADARFHRVIRARHKEGPELANGGRGDASNET